MKIKVATFNIQHCAYYPVVLETGKEEIRPDKVSELIRENAIEICGLNEVFVQTDGKLGDQPKDIASLLEYESAFAVGVYFGTTPYGNALVSKYPIKAVRSTPIVTKPEERIQTGFYEDRVLLEADIQIGGRMITVMTCHFGLMAVEMLEAEKVILNALKNATYPVILMGDFNMTPDAEIISHLKEYLFDVQATEGDLNLTFPSNAPKLKIDYVMVSKEWSCEHAYIPKTIVADHLPLVAELTLKK